MITAAAVTTTAAVIVTGNVKRTGVLIYNNSDTTVYLKLDSSADSLTAANGYPLVSGATLAMSTGPGDMDVFADIYAIHGGTGSKELRVQEFQRV